MNRIAVHPIKTLVQAWKRFSLRVGLKGTPAAGQKPQPSQTSKPRRRHTAFLEFP